MNTFAQFIAVISWVNMLIALWNVATADESMPTGARVTLFIVSLVFVVITYGIAWEIPDRRKE